jgi:excisionase family DNA binding protein
VTRGKLLTVREVSEWLSISEAWVRQHATGRRKPALPSIRLGKSLRFDEASVAQWLKEMAVLAAREGRAA